MPASNFSGSAPRKCGNNTQSIPILQHCLLILQKTNIFFVNEYQDTPTNSSLGFDQPFANPIEPVVQLIDCRGHRSRVNLDPISSSAKPPECGRNQDFDHIESLSGDNSLWVIAPRK